jgi:hypothetical protein
MDAGKMQTTWDGRAVTLSSTEFWIAQRDWEKARVLLFHQLEGVPQI